MRRQRETDHLEMTMRRTRVAASLALFGAIAPDVAHACKKGPYSPLRSPGMISFMGSATSDTLPVRAAHIQWGNSTIAAAPRYGMVVSVEQLTQHAKAVLPSSVSRVVVVAWNYLPDCSPTPRPGSAAWTASGVRGIFSVTLRDRKDWVDGLPTLDSHEPDGTPYPFGSMYQYVRPAAEMRLTGDELFPLLDLFPESRQLQDSADVHGERLLAWARANPSLASKYPVADAVSMTRSAVERGMLTRIKSPALGTYRFTVSMPGVADRIFYARSYDAPSSSWGMLGRTQPTNTDPTVPRAPFGYNLLMSVAPTLEQLETDCAKDRRMDAEAYMALVNEPGAQSGSMTQWRGMLEVALAARAFPDDATLRQLTRARYGEQVVRGGDPATPARFAQLTDGAMRVEQVFEYPDMKVELRGERISNAVVVGCRR
jgi:hypothetical protein